MAVDRQRNAHSRLYQRAIHMDPVSSSHKLITLEKRPTNLIVREAIKIAICCRHSSCTYQQVFQNSFWISAKLRYSLRKRSLHQENSITESVTNLGQSYLLSSKEKQDVSFGFLTHVNLDDRSDGRLQVVALGLRGVEDLHRVSPARYTHQGRIVKVLLK